ncbi:alpha/beta hydrolase [Streptomyces sp. NPDC006368]|uniref:alpha/beta hydrolase n=1 Tax=Streptomyces sp. NPDC006368 TaxID=3156760 RepID=UPI0033B68AD1
MRAVALCGAVGSLVLSPLAATPAGGLETATAEALGAARAAQRAAATGIAFGPCPAAGKPPSGVECGTVEVPLDYARSDGGRITLTVSRAGALGEPAERQGALVFNPGGPGAGSLWFPASAELPEWRRVARAYDLVGYTPRGVDDSAPLSCQDPADFVKAPTPAPAEPSASYKKERIARARAYARGCERHAGPALRHYTSLNNARDLEVLRAALGERKLTYLGASYGTYLGGLYATLFPGRVRRMVFDSVVDPSPGRIWYRNNLGQSRAFERRWLDFCTWVARHDDTYHLGADAEVVRRAYEKVSAELARRPAGGKVGPGRLQAAYLGAGYYDDLWVPRATALSEFLKGNAQPLIEQAAPRAEAAREAENGNAVHTAVECDDGPWPTDWRVWDRDNTLPAREAPFETWANVWLNLPCAYRPAPRQQPLDVRAEPGALPPTLILAAERDAATPYGVAGGPNACVNGYLEAYLLQGRTPVRRASCAPHREPDPVSLERRTPAV